MLARLEAIEGVAAAEVDHRGELLRLSLTSGQALEDAVRTLGELGYGTERLGEAPTVERWYRRDTVRELSREEGAVIARRVVTAFARSQATAASTAASTEDVVARALSAYFATHAIDRSAAPAALRREATDAVEAAARELLGADDARTLAAALFADLESAGSSEQATDPERRD